MRNSISKNLTLKIGILFVSISILLFLSYLEQGFFQNYSKAWNVHRQYYKDFQNFEDYKEYIHVMSEMMTIKEFVYHFAILSLYAGICFLIYRRDFNNRKNFDRIWNLNLFLFLFLNGLNDAILRLMSQGSTPAWVTYFVMGPVFVFIITLFTKYVIKKIAATTKLRFATSIIFAISITYFMFFSFNDISKLPYIGSYLSFFVFLHQIIMVLLESRLASIREKT